MTSLLIRFITYTFFASDTAISQPCRFYSVLTGNAGRITQKVGKVLTTDGPEFASVEPEARSADELITRMGGATRLWMVKEQKMGNRFLPFFTATGISDARIPRINANERRDESRCGKLRHVTAFQGSIMPSSRW